jgi:hypothetical protein
MQKKSLLAAWVVWSAFSLSAQGADRPADFQKYRWGDSERTVIRGRNQPLDTGPGGIVFQEMLGQITGRVTYRFANDGLTEVHYHFVAEHQTPAGFLTDFTKIERLLLSTHGPAESQRWEWHDATEQTDDPGAAIAAGKLTRLSEWRTRTSSITHSIFGDDGKVSHSLVYLPLATVQQPPAAPAAVSAPIAEPKPAEPEPAAPVSSAQPQAQPNGGGQAEPVAPATLRRGRACKPSRFNPRACSSATG